MKKFISSFGVLGASVAALDMQMFNPELTIEDKLRVPQHQDLVKTKLGHVVETSVFEDVTEKLIHVNKKPLYQDPREMTEHIKDLIQ